MASGTEGSRPESPAGDVLLLTRADVRRLLTMGECIEAVELAFRLHGQRAVPAPGVLGTHVPGGGFHVKAGVMTFEGRPYYAAKVNANFPRNVAERGLPTIQGVVVLFDAECGRPLAVIDSIEITGLRTGAATAVAAKYLARADGRAVTVIGCGRQARSQIEALLAVLPIGIVFACDVEPERAVSLAAEVGARWSVETRAATDFGAAARVSDVIVTCTPSRTAFLTSAHVRPGTFVAAVGADSEDKQELDPGLLAGNRVVPDIVEQASAIGELHHAIEAGLVQPGAITTDLGQIVAGRQPGRTSPDDIIIFDSTGMALQDVAAACVIYKRATTEDRVQRIALAL